MTLSTVDRTPLNLALSCGEKKGGLIARHSGSSMNKVWAGNVRNVVCQGKRVENLFLVPMIGSKDIFENLQLSDYLSDFNKLITPI